MAKKLIFLLSLIFIFSSFAPSADKIVGYWELTKVVSKFDFKKRKNKSPGGGFMLHFKEDGTVTTGRRIDKQKETRSGTYVFDVENMTLEIKGVGPDSDEPLIVTKLSNSKLVFKDKMSTIYFMKVKE